MQKQDGRRVNFVYKWRTFALFSALMMLLCCIDAKADEGDPFEPPEAEETEADDLNVEAFADDEVSGAVEEEVGDEDSEDLPIINNIFIDTDLNQALQDIGAEAGVNILTCPSVGGIVSAEIDGEPLDKALELILAGTGFEVVKINDYYLVFSPDESASSFLEVSNTQVIKMNNIRADRALRLLPSKLRNLARSDDESDVVVVTAPPRMMQRITEKLKKFDRPRQHVLLEARVVVLDRSTSLDLGVDWDFPQIQGGAFTDSERYDDGTGTMWPWGVRIGYTPGREFTHALNLTLNLMTQNEEASIVANPQLLVQDSRNAEIRVTTEEYFEIVTEGVTYARSQLETIETGTIMDIIPRIGDDGKVTLEMDIEVSDVVARGESNLPVVNRRNTQSTVQIESGGTAAVAGLLDTRTTDSQRAVPFMGRIPVLGRLFSSDATRQKEAQVAVFITATLLEHEDERFKSGRHSECTVEQIDEDRFRRQIKREITRMEISDFRER